MAWEWAGLCGRVAVVVVTALVGIGRALALAWGCWPAAASSPGLARGAAAVPPAARWAPHSPPSVSSAWSTACAAMPSGCAPRRFGGHAAGVPVAGAGRHRDGHVGAYAAGRAIGGPEAGAAISPEQDLVGLSAGLALGGAGRRRPCVWLGSQRSLALPRRGLLPGGGRPDRRPDWNPI